jgi:hypothetical protein
MRQLFERMTYIYAHKWVSVMGDATDDKGELTPSARTWQAGLSGITPQQLSNGLSKVTLSGNAWYPSLPEFRLMCIYRDDIPSITKTVQMLLESMRKGGSIAKRYQHPFVFAIAKNRLFDALNFRGSSVKQCEVIITPIYHEILQTGWNDFFPEHYEDQKALTNEKTKPSPEDVKTRVAQLRTAIGGGL